MQRFMKISLMLLAAGFILFFSAQQVIAAENNSPSPYSLLKDKKFKELDGFLQAKQHSYEAGNLGPGTLYEQFNFASRNESWLEAHLSVGRNGDRFILWFMKITLSPLFPYQSVTSHLFI